MDETGLRLDKADSTASSATDARVAKLENATSALAQQLMLQQLYIEEKTRSEGDSGLKQIRFRKDGPKSYYTATHSCKSNVAAFHEHANYAATCGLGEFVAVLNGVEFRTRHNDYKLIIEMREWFKAWRDGDYSVRDYRRYFRPVLCYLEGAWTSGATFEEPFVSERHQMEAKSWDELFDKVRFMSYTGDKSLDENLAFLPSMLINVTEGIPQFAQWNYRILCHPIEGDVDINDFEPVEDLGRRLSRNKETMESFTQSKMARFTLEGSTTDDYNSRLDEIMSQIPGANNYKANITDTMIGSTKLNLNEDTPLNVGYYHRWFRVTEKGAMGDRNQHRGFADRNLFVAENTQPRISPMRIKLCKFPNRRLESNRQCEIIEKRVTVAIPIEVVFLTPLQSWNPYNIHNKGNDSSALGLTVTADGRNGWKTVENAFDGANSANYYLTPAEFFMGGEVDRDSADTAKNSAGVLDPDGNLRIMAASGIRILLPNIPDVGVLRQRFPIMPVYAEGSPIWKELEALRDVVLDMQQYINYFDVAK
nr:hypothetical protein BaRGS_010714 [Batillaria attramentaria]